MRKKKESKKEKEKETRNNDKDITEQNHKDDKEEDNEKEVGRGRCRRRRRGKSIDDDEAEHAGKGEENGEIEYPMEHAKFFQILKRTGDTNPINIPTLTNKLMDRFTYNSLLNISKSSKANSNAKNGST